MNPVEEEKRIIEFWKENNIFEKSVENRPRSKQYVFYDGPPFATGLPHYGHILALTSKDLFPRYWTMKGYRCERRWGWDCHGLPIENIAEEDLGVTEKKDIEEEVGVEKFNNYCRSKVLGYADEWKKTVDRMGKWIEFDDSYKTMDKDYMESIWHIFKKLYDDGLIYEGKKILMYCPRCETPISKSEIAMDHSYQDTTEDSAFVKFELKSDDASVLAWTTTPWTLIGNIALAVNPNLTYLRVEEEGEEFIIAEQRKKLLNEGYEVIDEFKGKELIGLEYEPLYELTSEKAYLVVDGAEEVSAEEGTGIVHLAIYGEFDHEMIKEHDLAVVQHVDNRGKLVKGPEEWRGFFFKKADDYVFEDLKDRGLMYKKLPYSHSYPFCYRCETPLFYNAVDSWFINIQEIKDELIEKAEGVNWYPSRIKHGRFKHILETAPDWTISRNRYWATAIPAWKCTECEGMKVIGSVEELREEAVEEVPSDMDLHKHVVDDIHLKCSECNARMNRVSEVIDCWLESGSMPYASKHYPFENKDWFEENFPADFISEYVGQVRAWFYYMHVMGVLMFNKPAYKNVVVTGNILAADGSKMSKSKKNFPDPNKMFEKYGADAIRFYLMNSPLMRGEDLRFKKKGLKEVYRKVILLLGNIHRFYELFKHGNTEFNYTKSGNVLDEWILSRLNLLVKGVTHNLDEYDTNTTCDLITDFIEDLSTWYVRRSRKRFKKGDEEAIKTLAHVLLTLVKLMAPITPFITESIYQKFTKVNDDLFESVHLDTWPEWDAKFIDEMLNKEMVKVRKVVSEALDERSRKGIKVRQPLNEVVIKGASVDEKFHALIRQELNVKNIELEESGEELSAELDTRITPELRREGISRDLIRKINSYRKKLNLSINNRITLYFHTEDEEVQKSFEAYEDKIKEFVQADEVVFEKPEVEKTKGFKIRGSKITLSVELL